MTLFRPMFPPHEAPDTARGVTKRRRAAPAPTPAPLVDFEAFPDVFALTLNGDCLQPLIYDTSSAVIQKSAPYAVGDIVCVWFKPEFLRPDQPQAWLKRLRMAIPPWVRFPYREHPQSEITAIAMFEQLNPVRRYSVPCSHIAAIHRVIGICPPARNGECDMGKMSRIEGTSILPAFIGAA
jgi:hypothetical protein